MSPLRAALLALPVAVVATGAMASEREAFSKQREALIAALVAGHGLSPEQESRVREIFAASPVLGQGNPAIAVHPFGPEECRARREAAGVVDADPEAERICGGPQMAPLYDPARETADEARACIDRYEFPDLPCALPVVWVRAREAAELCSAVGKRLCDAHEWEGACAGALEPPDYRFDLASDVATNEAVRRMREAHNRARAPEKGWAYGPEPRKGVCAAASHKTEGCQGGGFGQCGSNTYPTGAFPGCVSALGVYDLHGNAAEHMNLPLDESQLASRGSETLGVTEMKGSWFIFDHYHAHEDWCRWRAPFWHGGRVMARDSHQNYHLGFRCCRDVAAPLSAPESP